MGEVSAWATKLRAEVKRFNWLERIWIDRTIARRLGKLLAFKGYFVRVSCVYRELIRLSYRIYRVINLGGEYTELEI